MLGKIGWLTFWVTMTLWLGHFWGCAAAPEQAANHRVLASDEGVDAPGLGPVEGTPVPAAREPVPEVARELGQKEADYVPQSYGVTLAEGLSRQAWPVTSYAPASGRSPHLPIYWRDLWMERDETAVFAHDQSNDAAKRQAALDSGYDTCCSGTKFYETGAQYGKFGFDTLAMPVMFFIEPGWQWKTTPPKP